MKRHTQNVVEKLLQTLIYKKNRIQNLILVRNADTRGRSRAGTTSKMECFVIIVNGLQLLTISTKHSILNVASAQDPPLDTIFIQEKVNFIIDEREILKNCSTRVSKTIKIFSSI